MAYASSPVAPSVALTTCSLLQSVLCRGEHRLFCEVVTVGDGRYEVHVMPDWDLSSSVIETFSAFEEAAWRHTELSWFFQQTGWERMANHVQPAA